MFSSSYFFIKISQVSISLIAIEKRFVLLLQETFQRIRIGPADDLCGHRVHVLHHADAATRALTSAPLKTVVDQSWRRRTRVHLRQALQVVEVEEVRAALDPSLAGHAGVGALGHAELVAHHLVTEAGRHLVATSGLSEVVDFTDGQSDEDRQYEDANHFEKVPENSNRF